MFGRFAFLAAAWSLSASVALNADEVETKSTKFPADQQAFLNACEPWDEWDKPASPFKVFGNTYYVGTCGIAAILIKGDDGHALIDTGTANGAKIVWRNIKRTGADPKDIKLLLHSHEHFDHVGGMAYFQENTDAKVRASEPASLAMITGVSHPDDPQLGMHEPMQIVKLVHVISYWEKITLNDGALELTPIVTPGHSPGALSWQWESCEGDTCKTIVYADSLSPVSADDYKFSDHPEYLAEYRAGIERLHGLDCDILLTPHPSHSKMLERMKTGTLEGGMSCAEYADSKTAALDTRLAKERGE